MQQGFKNLRRDELLGKADRKQGTLHAIKKVEQMPCLCLTFSSQLL